MVKTGVGSTCTTVLQVLSIYILHSLSSETEIEETLALVHGFTGFDSLFRLAFPRTDIYYHSEMK